MPARSSPTLRQRRLGAELRRMRERAGLSIQAASELLGMDRPRVTNMELARFGVSEERLRSLASHYSCADTAYVDALAAMTRKHKPGWWEEYRGILPAGLLELSELEYHATAMHSVQTTHMPGLLQTAEHARAIFEQTLPRLPLSQLEARVSHRIRRQVVLERRDPPPYHAIVHEAALRMQFGGPKVAHRQLLHLLAASEHDKVTVLVVPFAAGGFPGAGHSILYSSGAVPQLDTVQLDTAHASVFLYAEAHLNNYQELLDRVKHLALDPKESREFIHRLAQQIS